MTENKTYLILTHLYNKDLFKGCELCGYFSLIGIYDLYSANQLYFVDNILLDIYDVDDTILNINSDISSYKVYYKKLLQNIENKKDLNDVVSNYTNIIKNNQYIQPELGYFVKLKCGNFSVVKKTFWLKIFQKKIKNYINHKKKN
jgi:hypothetical protein